MRLDAVQLMTNLPLIYASTVSPPVVVSDDGDDGVMPQDLRSWLVRLRLLEGVPFANLVADTELLPPESIRWFYLDRRWTDALVQGALSVGTVNSDDRMQLTAAVPRGTRRARQRGAQRAPDAGFARGSAARSRPISGFLLRSAAVAGWPGLHVRAFSVEPAGGRRPARTPRTTPSGCGCCGSNGSRPPCCCAFRRRPEGRAHRGAPPGRAVRVRRAPARTATSARRSSPATSPPSRT